MKAIPFLALPLLLVGSQAWAQTPTLTISDAIGFEGNSGTTDFVFTVTLSEAASAPVRVKWATDRCTADPKPPCGTGDYIDADGVLDFAVGATTRTIVVQVLGDTEPEGQEVFLVVLSEPQNAALSVLPQGQGQGIINNDDGALPAPPVADYNADGRTDILWRNQASHRLVVWAMDGLNKLGGGFVTVGGSPVTADPNSSVVGTADFDGDGDADILLQNNVTGVLEYWYLNGMVRVDQRFRDGLADTNWKVAGTADFNSDGRRDLLWRHETTGRMHVWYMNDRVLLGTADLNPAFVPTITDPSIPDLNWRIAGLGDFDKDGDPDILFRHAASHRLVVWLMDGVNKVGGDYVNPDRPIDHDLWDVAGVWDVDQNGIADIVFRHRVSGSLVVWYLDEDQDRVCGTYFNPPALADLNWLMVGPR